MSKNAYFCGGMNKTVAKPFVKWVGGKTQLLDEVRKSLPADLCQYKDFVYVESFVGGGAVLFWILQEYPNIERAIINDINPELICSYRVVKNDVHTLIEQLEVLQDGYLLLNAEERKSFYLQKRALFNSKCCSDIETAALFIFLNKTCFNGLYRVNSKGEFNVPHGTYSNPKICDKENLVAVSKVLQRVEILCGDFAVTEKYAGPNTLFYLDPPYKPLSATSSFTSYATGGFDDAEQIRLRDFCVHIVEQGAQFVESNSDPKEDAIPSFFERLYSQFYIKRVFANRFINSKPEHRGAVSEIMISNIAKV